MPALTVPGTRRLSNLDPLTPKQLRDAERDSVYIYNVCPREFRVYGGLKMYIIPACPKGAEVSDSCKVLGTVYTTKVKSVHGREVEYEWHQEDGIDVAKDVVGTAPFKDSSENLTEFGVFIAAGEEPTPEEIAQARSKWIARCNEIVRNADAQYAINKGMVDLGGGRLVSNIGADAREAVEVLGFEREYATKDTVMVKCEDCGTANVSTAARCKECHAIFDEAKCRVRYPQMFAHEVEKRGPGRPPANRVTE